MKVHVTAEGYLDRINKALEPSTAHGEYIGVTLIEPAAAQRAGRRARGHLAARPVALLRGRLPGVRRPRRARRHRADRRRRVGRGRRPPRPRACPGGRVPLLTRMVGTPLTIDIGPGAVAGLAPLLADRRISSGGHVAVIVGPGLGEEIAATLRPQLANAEIWDVEGGSRAGGRRAGRAAARRASTTRWWGSAAAARSTSPSTPPACSGLPWWRSPRASPTTASPRRSPRSSDDEAGHKGSFGVQMPIAVVVDLDYVRRSEPAMRRSGIGDAISNLSAIADWRLAERERGEEVDGVAVTFARVAATSLVHREDGIDDDAFLIALAEALVLSRPGDGHGRVEPPVQRRRPRDPARDRHAVPGHGQPRRAGRRREPVHVLPARATRGWPTGSTRACAATACRARRATSG